jgi:hypothetical protein
VKSLSLIQAVRDTSVKEKAQYNLINALKSEHLKRKDMSYTLHDEQQKKIIGSITAPSGESPAQVQNLVQIFALDRLIHDLESTPQAHDCSSVTSNVIKALTEGRKRLISLGGSGCKGQKLEKPVGRICPFCERWFINSNGLSTHLKTHEGEPNYKSIREAFKLGFEYNYFVS